MTKHEEIVHKGLQTVKIFGCGATHDTQRKTRAKEHLFVVAKKSPPKTVKNRDRKSAAGPRRRRKFLGGYIGFGAEKGAI